MENTYHGIGVTNRYALFLDEEEDPLEVLKRQEQERETKRKSKNVSLGLGLDKESKAKNTEAKQVTVRKIAKDTQNANVASTKSAESAKSKDEITNSKGVNQRNVKFLGDSREDRNNKRNRDERMHQISDSISRDAPRENQGRGLRSDMTIGIRDGPREGFGRGFRSDMTGGLREGQSRGLREGQSRGLREGQSRGPRNDISGLREGQGRGPRNDLFGEDRRGRGMGSRGAARGRSYRGIPGNRGSYDIRVKRDFDRPFGSDKVEQRLVTEAPSNEWVAEAPAPPEVVPGEAIMAPAVTEAVVENPAPVEEEPHELTLDEYKALRGSRQKPTYNLRKAGEGEDLTQWNNMYELSKKKDEEEPDEEEASEYDVLEYPQRVGRQKHLSIDIHFTDGRRGSRGRGARGSSRGSRGSGPRGGGVGPRPDEAARAPRGRGDYQGPAFRGERGMRFMSERGFRAERGEHSELYGSRGGKQSAPKVDDEHDFPSLG